MPKIVESEEYLNTQEVLSMLQASKKRFYQNIKPHLHSYHFDAMKTPWYRTRDILALQTGKPVRKAEIRIGGLLKDWTAYLGSLGFRSETVYRSVEVTTLPGDAMRAFRLAQGQQFLKRSGLSTADGEVICVWDSYYPLELVADILDQLKAGSAIDVVAHIRQRHNLVITHATDRYTARDTTLDEQNIFRLLTDEPMLILQRVSYTADEKVLVLYSDMVLRASWFAPEYSYSVNIW